MIIIVAVVVVSFCLSSSVSGAIWYNYNSTRQNQELHMAYTIIATPSPESSRFTTEAIIEAKKYVGKYGEYRIPKNASCETVRRVFDILIEKSVNKVSARQKADNELRRRC